MINFFYKSDITVLGGTGSIGSAIVDKLLNMNEIGPNSVTILSRDESKQFYMQNKYRHIDKLIFKIGDVRYEEDIKNAIENSNIVINAAAMKHVPSCEYNPEQAVRTNVNGLINCINAIKDRKSTNSVKFINISTDKVCNPSCVMGITKSLQEKITSLSNCNNVCFISTRFGNVLESRGSVIELFKKQIKENKPITLTNGNMTRFIMTKDDVVNTITYAIVYGNTGDIIIPKLKALKMFDLVDYITTKYNTEYTTIGSRPGEKLHELLYTDDESVNLIEQDKYYIINKLLHKNTEYKGDCNSKDFVMTKNELKEYLEQNGI